MKKILLASFLLISLAGSAQWKKWFRLKTFDSIHVFLKENYAGYDDKVNIKSTKAFEAFTRRQKALISESTSDAQHLLIERRWLDFFKDEHLGISMRFDTSGGKWINEILMKSGFPLDQTSLARLEKKDTSAIEGIYYTRDSSYQVAVVKEQKGFASYKGIIISSKNKEWIPGAKKFELVDAGKDLYDVIWYNRYNHPQFSRLNFQHGNTFHTEGWYKKGRNKDANNPVSNYKPPFEEENKFNAFFKQIDEQTSYLRIRSFDADYIAQIDSVIKTNQALLENLPYLVIDIRGNGGGADIAYRPLRKLLYTDPVKMIGVDLIATPYNIEVTSKLINSIEGIPEAEKKEYDELLEKARNSKGRMFNFFHDTTEVMQGTVNPVKVALIIDQRCASTAEQFILEARQSKKTTLFGVNTMGVLDYANVRDVDFRIGFSVHYPTTRSRRIDVGQGIDNIGIKPDVPVDFQKEGWLQKVVQEIKK